MPPSLAAIPTMTTTTTERMHMYEDQGFDLWFEDQYEDRWVDPAEWLDEVESWMDDEYDRERDWEAEMA